MKLQSKLRMFVLTREEQRTIAFIVLAVALGLWTKHYRLQHSKPAVVPNELKQPAATPEASRPGGASSASPKLKTGRRRAPPSTTE